MRTGWASTLSPLQAWQAHVELSEQHTSGLMSRTTSCRMPCAWTGVQVSGRVWVAVTLVIVLLCFPGAAVIIGSFQSYSVVKCALSFSQGCNAAICSTLVNAMQLGHAKQIVPSQLFDLCIKGLPAWLASIQKRCSCEVLQSTFNAMVT